MLDFLKPLEEKIFSAMKKKQPEKMTLVAIALEINVSGEPGFSLAQMDNAMHELIARHLAFPSQGITPIEYGCLIPKEGTDMHTHYCDCGNQWTHSNDSFGDDAAHTCHKCGRQVWSSPRTLRFA